MIGDVTLRGIFLSTARTMAKAPVRSADALPELDPKVAKRLAEQRDEARQAIDTLKQTKVNAGDQRKQIAKEKLELIKRALQSLRMMGGDPKTLAKEGARLARELAAAVKEYAAAGGTGATGAVAGGPQAAAAGPASADGKRAAEGVPAEGASAEGAKSGSASAESADSGSADPEPGNAESDGSAAEGQEVGTDAGTAQDGNAEPGTPGQPGATRGEGKGGNAAGKDDQDFAEEAKLLAKKLKALLLQQRERLQASRSDDAKQDIKTGLDDLRETEKIVNSLSSGGAGGAGGVLATVNLLV